MPVLLLAEHDGRSLSEQTGRTLTAALAIDPAVHILVAGCGVQAIAAEAAALADASEVLLADDPSLAVPLDETLADLLVALAPDYGALLAPATASGKSVMPRVAALLDVAQISEVIEVVAPDSFKRPIYAGNAIQTVRASGQVVATVRTSAFAAAEAGGEAPVRRIAAGAEPTLSSFVDQSLTVLERPELTAAKIVVSGGRATGSRERFDELILPFADRLGAAVGASRAAVDAGYAPNDWQVGQTGKIVAPDVYFALGISGAIQHLAGMKDSRTIVAINNDPDAPIFQIADYGLVADIFEAVPELQQQL